LLEYVNGQVEPLKQTGFLDSDDVELAQFTQAALDALDKYPIKLLPPVIVKGN
jgi:hypothetical protein